MDSEASTMCWMVAINGDDTMMDDIIAVLMAPEVTTLPDYTLGRQAADFQVTSVLFPQRPWAHHPHPPWKQAWRRPTCPSPVTTYVCTTWRIPSRFLMCLHERCITWMDILQVTKRYSYSQIDHEQQRPQTKDKCVGLWRTWSLGSTTLRTSAVQPSADVETFLGSRWYGAKWDLGILCHFFPMAHPMALKRPCVRLKFFVPPAVPQNILFFLLEETDPSASVIVLAAVHPKDRKKNLVSGWKIWVMVF